MDKLGGGYMKEMFKSKGIILFILFVLMFTFVNSLNIQKDVSANDTDKQITFVN